MCNCIAKVDALLAPYNAELVLPLFSAKKVFVETQKKSASKRGKPPKMEATYCPFCGEKYPTEPAEPAHGEALS